jgi:hypothetical protein
MICLSREIEMTTSCRIAATELEDFRSKVSVEKVKLLGVKREKNEFLVRSEQRENSRL